MSSPGPSTPVVRPLDVTDEAAVRAAWEVGLAAVAERRYHSHLAWQAARTYTMGGRVGVDVAHLVAVVDDVVVGVAEVQAPTFDNTDLAYADVAVHPDHRRLGVGSALLGAVVGWARDHGRTVLTGEVFAPVGADSPGTLFARHHGFVDDLEDGLKVADLQATRDSWPALVDEAAPAHADYRVVTAWDPLPEDLVEGYCRLQNRFFELAPSGDLQREPEHWDAARVRAMEERASLAGRVDSRAFALAADGTVAAVTELVLNTTTPHRAMQGGTIVLPDHRGHRLGLALKARNHLALVERFPDVEWIVTTNADVNEHMNAINDRLGFRVVERCVEVTRTL